MVIDGTGSLSAIACPDACLAVGADSSLSVGVVVPIAAGLPGSALTAAATTMLLGISCPYAGTCLAVGSGPKGTGVVVPVVSGQLGSAQRVAGSALLSGLVCPTTSTCDAVGTSSPGNQGVLVVAASTPTVTTLSSSANPIRIKLTVTYTATVSPTPAGDPSSGTVQFADDGAVIPGCSAQPVNAGRATCATTYLNVDPDREIEAVYSGDGSSAPSTSPLLNERVNRFSSTTLSASVHKIFTGQPVTYTATVSPSPGSGSAAGTVAFTNEGAAISACAARPITSGRAKCTTSYPKGGTHSVAAKYSGDNTVLIHSTSPTLIETVIATTSTAVSASPDPARIGQAVTYSATISPSPGSGTGAGTVTFADGGVVIATCAQQPVTDGVASCTVTYSTARSHSVVAEYGGTSTYLSSKSAPESETVISVPSAPVGLTAGSDNGGATLTWSPPPSAGGRSVIGYDVYERTSTNSAFAGPVNGSALVAGTSVTLDGLTNGGTYYFIVEAVNEVGNSPPSNEASAQPTGSRPAPAVRGQPGGKTSVVSASPPRPGSPSADQPGAGSSLFGGATGSGGPPKGSASSQGGNGGPSGGNSSGGNPAGTSGTPSHGRHASVAAFGPKAYANDGRGPDVSYARSVGTGLYGGPPGFVPLAQAVPTPLDASWRPAHLLKDIGLAALLILLLALPAELLNLSFRTRGEGSACRVGGPPTAAARREVLWPAASRRRFRPRRPGRFGPLRAGRPHLRIRSIDAGRDPRLRGSHRHHHRQPGIWAAPLP